LSVELLLCWSEFCWRSPRKRGAKEERRSYMITNDVTLLCHHKRAGTAEYLPVRVRATLARSFKDFSMFQACFMEQSMLCNPILKDCRAQILRKQHRGHLCLYQRSQSFSNKWASL
jgi:hypothetical protein